MATINDKERLAVLEVTTKQIKDDVERLVVAVDNLTSMVEQSRGARKFVGWLAGSALTITTTWLALKELFHR